MPSPAYPKMRSAPHSRSRATTASATSRVIAAAYPRRGGPNQRFTAEECRAHGRVARDDPEGRHARPRRDSRARKTVCPVCSLSLSSKACRAVTPIAGMAAASSKESSAGFLDPFALATTISANAPPVFIWAAPSPSSPTQNYLAAHERVAAGDADCPDDGELWVSGDLDEQACASWLEGFRSHFEPSLKITCRESRPSACFAACRSSRAALGSSPKSRVRGRRPGRPEPAQVDRTRSDRSVFLARTGAGSNDLPRSIIHG
jgi:hypothetical protein